MSVRAKFYLASMSEPKPATRYLGGGKTELVEAVNIVLQTVVSGSPENDKFYTNTPSGSITLNVVNLEAAKQFERGKQYYVDFTEAN